MVFFALLKDSEGLFGERSRWDILVLNGGAMEDNLEVWGGGGYNGAV